MPSLSSTLPGLGLSALVQELAPAPVSVTYCAGNALPFRIEWTTARGTAMFYGLTPDAAAAEAGEALARGTVERPAQHTPITDPMGNSPWAEAMRELIADLDERRREPKRPLLRIVR